MLIACSAQKTNDDVRLEHDITSPAYVRNLVTGKQPAPKPEEYEGQLAKAGEDWLYGPGLGRTTLNVGTVLLFPPYALYLLTNAGLALAGYDPIYITDALPEEPKETVDLVYTSITDTPGQLAATLAGENFRTEEMHE